MRRWPTNTAHYLTRLAGLESIKATRDRRDRARVGHGHGGELTLLVPMAGLIDPQAEIERLTKRIAKNESDIGKLSGQARQREFRAECAAGRGRGRPRARGGARSAEREPGANSSTRVRRLGGLSITTV